MEELRACYVVVVIEDTEKIKEKNDTPEFRAVPLLLPGMHARTSISVVLVMVMMMIAAIIVANYSPRRVLQVIQPSNRTEMLLG